MNKNHSYYSRLNPKQRRASPKPEWARQRRVANVEPRDAPIQPEPIFAFSAVGPASEF